MTCDNLKTALHSSSRQVGSQAITFSPRLNVNVLSEHKM